MNYIFWLIIGLDGIIIILNHAVSIESVLINKQFKKVKSLKQIGDKNNIPTNTIGKVVFVLMTIIFSVVVLAVSLSIIWVPIVINKIFGWRPALASFMMIFALLSVLLIIIFNKFAEGHQNKEGAIIKEAISITFFVLMSIFVLYGPIFPLEHLIEMIFSGSTNFSFTLTIFIPVLVISLLITNVYLFINSLFYFMDKSKKVIKPRTKIIDILAIFTLGSFFALFFIVDRNWSFVANDNSSRFYQTVDLFKNILVAVLVPLILSKFIRKDVSNIENTPNNVIESDKTLNNSNDTDA